MALSDQEQYIWGENRIRFVDTSANLPTVNPSGMWNPGDIIFVKPPIVGGPSYYVCTASAGPSNSSNQGTATWAPVGVVSTNANRTSAAPVTVTPSDANGYVVVSSAGAVTLPLASTMPAFAPVNIINASGGSITLTATGGTIAGAAAVTVATPIQYTAVPSTGTVWYS